MLKLCRKHKLKYTRYIDDITISGNKDFRNLLQAIKGNIELLGYQLNKRKTKFYFKHERQVVNGLVVNDKVSPTNDFIKNTKQVIRRCRDEGASAIADECGLSVKRLRQQIMGRISFVRSVYPKKGRELRGLIVGINWKS